MQNAIVHFALNLRLSDHVSPLEKAANMLLMEDICKMILCCLVHKDIYLKALQTSVGGSPTIKRLPTDRPSMVGGFIFPEYR